MPRLLVLAGILSSALLALTGCAGAADSPRPAAAAPTSAASSGAPTATPAPSAAQMPAAHDDPADPGTWVVDFDRVANVHVGDSTGALAAAAGLPKVDDTVDCPPGYGLATPGTPVAISLLELASRGHDVADPVLTYALVRAPAAPDSVVASSPSTAEGIRLGSTEAELMAAYPGIRATASRYDETMNYTTYVIGPSGDRFLVFQVGISPSGARTVVDFQTSTEPYIWDVCD